MPNIDPCEKANVQPRHVDVQTQEYLIQSFVNVKIYVVTSSISIMKITVIVMIVTMKTIASLTIIEAVACLKITVMKIMNSICFDTIANWNTY